MRLLHSITGGLLIVLFLVTGQYMQHIAGPMHELADGPRMIYRSAHIYLLLIALLHLALGLDRDPAGLARYIAIATSALSVPVTALLIAGFFYDASTGDLSRPYGRPGLYGCFGIGMLLGLRTIVDRRRRD